MSYEIDYSSDTNTDVRRTRAIADIKSYIGDDKFDEFNTLLTQAIAKGEIKDENHFRLILFLFPVSGYPLTAWYETIKLSLVES